MNVEKSVENIVEDDQIDKSEVQKMEDTLDKKANIQEFVKLLDGSSDTLKQELKDSFEDSIDSILEEQNFSDSETCYILQGYAKLICGELDIYVDGKLGPQTLAILRGIQGREFSNYDKKKLGDNKEDLNKLRQNIIEKRIKEINQTIDKVKIELRMKRMEKMMKTKKIRRKRE